MPPDFEFRKHVEQLAAEFQRRGMKKHLDLLRAFYRFEFVGRVKPPDALSIVATGFGEHHFHRHHRCPGSRLNRRSSAWPA